MRLIAIVIILAIPAAVLAQDKAPKEAPPQLQFLTDDEIPRYQPPPPYGLAPVLCDSIVARDCFAVLRRLIGRREELARPANRCSVYRDPILWRDCERNMNDYLKEWWENR